MVWLIARWFGSSLERLIDRIYFTVCMCPPGYPTSACKWSGWAKEVLGLRGSWAITIPLLWMWVCLKIVYPYTQWFCWSLSLLNGYNWGYTSFSDIPMWHNVTRCPSETTWISKDRGARRATRTRGSRALRACFVRVPQGCRTLSGRC